MSGPIAPDELNMVPPLDYEVLDGEPWIKIRVSDGTVIKVRTFVVMVKRLPGQEPGWNVEVRGGDEHGNKNIRNPAEAEQVKVKL